MPCSAWRAASSLTRVIDDGVYNGVLIGAALVCVVRAWRVREERRRGR